VRKREGKKKGGEGGREERREERIGWRGREWDGQVSHEVSG
jgi:hypothetical protein